MTASPENPIIRYVEIDGAETFDEFVAHDATVHFEVMGNGHYWMQVDVGDRSWHINCGVSSHFRRGTGYAICEELT